MKDQVKDDIRRLTDVFTCADGGAEYVLFRCFMEGIAEHVDLGQPIENLEASKQLCDILHKCRRLVDTAIKLSSNTQ